MLNATSGFKINIKVRNDLFPAVTSTAVKNFSSQFSNSIIGP